MCCHYHNSPQSICSDPFSTTCWLIVTRDNEAWGKEREKNLRRGLFPELSFSILIWLPFSFCDDDDNRGRPGWFRTTLPSFFFFLFIANSEMKMKFVFLFCSLSPCFISAPGSATRNWRWPTLFLFRVRSLVLEIFLFHSFAMINSYRRSFNINFALSFLSLSLHFWWQELKVNWATSPVNAPKQETNSKSSRTSWLSFILCHSYYAPNVRCACVFFLRWRAPFLSESFLIWLFIVSLLRLGIVFFLVFFFLPLFYVSNRPRS